MSTFRRLAWTTFGDGSWLLTRTGRRWCWEKIKKPSALIAESVRVRSGTDDPPSGVSSLFRWWWEPYDSLFPLLVPLSPPPVHPAHPTIILILTSPPPPTHTPTPTLQHHSLPVRHRNQSTQSDFSFTYVSSASVIHLDDCQTAGGEDMSAKMFFNFYLIFFVCNFPSVKYKEQLKIL